MFGKQLRTRTARIAAAIGLLGALAGAGVFGQAALASGSHARARDRSSSAQTASANADLHAAAQQAVQGLVTGGTINQQQAEAIDDQIDAGTVDPGQLVSSGVVSQSQMTTVAGALAQVKRSFAPAGGPASAGANTKSPRGQQANGSPPAPVTAAIQGLVTGGTITQHQADAILTQITSGTFDPQQLAASGVINASQATALANALGAVKRAAAAGQP